MPTDATIDSEVVITIGNDSATTYPLTTTNGVPIYITQLQTRRIYPCRVRTTPTAGVFVYTGRCLPSNNITVSDTIPVPTATVATTTTGGGAKTEGGTQNA